MTRQKTTPLGKMNTKEIQDRIEKANKAMTRLTKIWKMENIQLKEKIIIYNLIRDMKNQA